MGDRKYVPNEGMRKTLMKEIINLPDKEFKEAVIKMLNKF